MLKENDLANIKIVDLKSIFNILKKRIRILLLGIFGMVLFSIISSFFILKPIYEAKTLLRVAHPVQLTNSQSVDGSGLEGTVNNLSSLPKMTMQTHVSQLQSEALIDRVAKKMNIQESDLQGKLLSELFEISVIKDSNLILLTARHNNPVLARDLVNNLGQEYIKFISETSQQQMEQTINFLEKQYILAQGKINEAQIKSLELLSKNERNLTAEEKTMKENLKMEIDNQRKTMELLAEGIAQARIKGGVDFGQANLVVVSAAETPIKPVKPNKMLNIVLAFIIGLIIFLPLALILEHLNNKIKTPEDVEQNLSLPVLGVIPRLDRKSLNGSEKDSLVNNERKKIPVCYSPKSMAAEAFRMLQTNLGFSISGAPCRSILITSPVQNTGKSMVASNLAVVLAQTGHKVLIVDCDLRKPTQHKIFGLDNSRGLVNVLLQNISISECAHKTDEGPWVLTSGPIPPNTLEIISSKQLQSFWQEQLQEYDYILVDAPPVLPLADPIVLASQLNGVILIFDANATPIDSALEVTSRLSRVNAKVIGAVLNRVKLKNENYYY